MKNMMYRDAVREALDEEMARDDTVFNMIPRWKLQMYRRSDGQVRRLKM